MNTPGIIAFLALIQFFIIKQEIFFVFNFYITLLLFLPAFPLGGYIAKNYYSYAYTIGWIGFFVSIFLASIILFYLYKYLKSKNWKIYKKQAIFLFSLFQFIRFLIFIEMCLTKKSSLTLGHFIIVANLNFIGYIIPIIYIYNIIMLVRDKDNSISLSLTAFIMFILTCVI